MAAGEKSTYPSTTARRCLLTIIIPPGMNLLEMLTCSLMSLSAGFETDSKGELRYESYQDQYHQVLQYTRQRGIRTHLGVALMDKEALHALLANKNYRQYLIQQLTREGYSG